MCVCVCVCGRPGCARPCYNAAAPPARRLKGPTAAPSSMRVCITQISTGPPPQTRKSKIRSIRQGLDRKNTWQDSPHQRSKALLMAIPRQDTKQGMQARRQGNLVTLGSTTLTHITHRQHVRGHLHQMAQGTIPLKLHTSLTINMPLAYG